MEAKLTGYVGCEKIIWRRKKTEPGEGKIDLWKSSLLCTIHPLFTNPNRNAAERIRDLSFRTTS